MTFDPAMQSFHVVPHAENRYSLYREAGEFFENLNHPNTMRAIEHCLSPEVGQHKLNADPLCPVCVLHMSQS